MEPQTLNLIANIAIALVAILSTVISIGGIVSNRFKARSREWNARFDKLDQKFDKIDLRFDKIDKRFDKVDLEFKEVRADLTEVKERLAFLEAANIYTMPLEPIQPNARSQAAKERWVRRRQKSIEKKNG